MKNLLTFAILLACLTTQAQKYKEVKPTSNYKDVKVLISGSNVPALESKNGVYYIQRTSKKTGNEYKMYLGYKVEDTFKDSQIFSNKAKSAFWYFKKTKTGYSKRPLQTVK